MKMAREFAHLTWLKSKKDARHNLGSSSILSMSLGDIGPLDMSWQVGDANPAGDPELVGLVSETYGVERDRVFITMGAGEANLHAAMVCVEKGCDVLVERPVYHSLAEVSRFLGARVVHFDRRLENGFGIDLEDLKRRLTRKCRLVVLTNLHNPSCAMLDRETVKAVAEIAADRGARVLSDEVYLDCGGAAAPPSMRRWPTTPLRPTASRRPTAPAGSAWAGCSRRRGWCGPSSASGTTRASPPTGSARR